ncbi:NUDIX hydrolase [Blastococcus sp. TF02-09]|uniref:NUDIX hydrolase n=1 Tax=Blastococcus sp. TF02-09 TaxID=2250576 RepID=UPI000DE99F04|nr:bifunctional NUDIX hydrolase/histidine phosphatase family protein [Blastococcus sp. TF02-9]RBY77453.1 NUDIX hydrolase [Blastococcus sp. TF02-9]
MIAAAGGVIWRPAGDGIEIAVVHRERHDDWSLPKGHVDAGEHPVQTACREVVEETGLAVVAGRRGLTTRYEVDGLPKRVDYWLMRCTGGAFVPNSEADELRWLPPADAATLCSYEPDREVIADAARGDLPREVAVLLVRHGKAGSSDRWEGPDEERPLTAAGEAQARRLAEVLALFGPVSVASATPLRCRQTVAPLAGRIGLAVAERREFGEPEFGGDPQEAYDAVLRALGEPGAEVVCSQGGTIPAVLQALGVHGHGVTGLLPPAAKGSVWALGGRPGALVADYYRDFEADPDARA